MLAGGVLLAALLGVGRAEPTRWTAQRDGLSLELQLDKESILVAEPIRVRLSVRAPKGTRIQFSEVPESWGEFRVLSTRPTDDVPAPDGSDRREWLREVVVETYRTGDVKLPPWEILYALETDGSAFQRWQSPEILVRVRSVLDERADPTRYRDLKPVVEPTPQPASRLVWLAGSTLLALAATAAFVAGWVWRRRAALPEKWALGMLQRLSEKWQFKVVSDEQIVDELVRLLYLYATRRGAARPSNGLGDPIQDRLAASPGSLPDQEIWNRIMELAGQIRFARRPIDHDEVGRMLSLSREWIRLGGNAQSPSPRKVKT